MLSRTITPRSLIVINQYAIYQYRTLQWYGPAIEGINREISRFNVVGGLNDYKTVQYRFTGLINKLYAICDDLNDEPRIVGPPRSVEHCFTTLMTWIDGEIFLANTLSADGVIGVERVLQKVRILPCCVAV